jgi:hypothetical protein
VLHLATFIFLNFQIEPELVGGIDPGMAFTPFSSSIFYEIRFEPTSLRSKVEFAIHYTGHTPYRLQAI